MLGLSVELFVIDVFDCSVIRLRIPFSMIYSSSLLLCNSFELCAVSSSLKYWVFTILGNDLRLVSDFSRMKSLAWPSLIFVGIGVFCFGCCGGCRRFASLLVPGRLFV